MNTFEKQYFESEVYWQNGMLLDDFNRGRIELTKELIPSDVTNLVDVGCGNGIFLNSLVEDGRKIELLGVDRSRTALKYVRANKTEGDITSLEFENASFDCVTSLEVLEHLPVNAFQRALSELARISRKYIIISVPFEEKLEDNFATCPHCHSVFNRDLHLRSFSEDTFRNLLNGFGYRNMEIRKAGPIRTYIGHATYRKIFHRDEFMRWDVPICPVCGFEKEEENAPDHGKSFSLNADSTRSNSSINSLLTLPKALWPKTTKYYWIMGLFKRTAV